MAAHVAGTGARPARHVAGPHPWSRVTLAGEIRGVRVSLRVWRHDLAKAVRAVVVWSSEGFGRRRRRKGVDRSGQARMAGDDGNGAALQSEGRAWRV